MSSGYSETKLALESVLPLNVSLLNASGHQFSPLAAGPPFFLRPLILSGTSWHIFSGVLRRGEMQSPPFREDLGGLGHEQMLAPVTWKARTSSNQLRVQTDATAFLLSWDWFPRTSQLYARSSFGNVFDFVECLLAIPGNPIKSIFRWSLDGASTIQCDWDTNQIHKCKSSSRHHTLQWLELFRVGFVLRLMGFVVPGVLLYNWYDR